MKVIASLLLALALGSTLVHAGEKKSAGAKQGQDPAEVFKQLDTNNDGKLSLDEFLVGKKNQDKAKDQFKAKDTDGDGFLTLEEFSAHGKKAK